MTMRSYAQNREDVLLDRMFPRGVTGFYIDVGANDPVSNSVTKHFYDLGWSGINVEPAQGPFDRLVEERPRDLNLNIGLSDRPGKLTFYELPAESSGGSTFSAAQAERHRNSGIPSHSRTVEVATLAQVCEDHVTGNIDFLSVDVEEHEREVLEGGDWTRWRPRVVLVEATQPTTTIPTHDQWEHVLVDADYLFGAFDGLNRYYVRSEDRNLLPALETPVNVIDDFIPHEYLETLANLRGALESTQRSLAATRAVKDMLWAEYSALPQELSRLRAEHERLDRALLRMRSEYEAFGVRLAEEGDPYAELLREVGPIGLALARRLTRVSSRLPAVASTSKRLMRKARSLQ